MTQNKPIRLAKFLANSGIASRRQSEEIILDGRVKVNHKIVTVLATLVDPAKDKIAVDNTIIDFEKKVYYLLNKPVGYVSSVSDPHNPENVLSLLPQGERVYPVGRLDKDSQGLLLLTNDGELTFHLTHPKFNVQKKYLVKVGKLLSEDIIADLKQGVRLEEGLAKADEVEIKNNKELIITIHQGWKRQIRRMLGALDYNVLELTRLSEGKLSLGNLPVGKFKKLKKEDII